MLDGLITFYSWSQAMRAEKVLGRKGFDVLLIPAPRELSRNCGTALRCEYGRRESMLPVLAESKVRIEAIHPYIPPLEDAVSAVEERRSFRARWRSLFPIAGRAGS
ncbi:MAG: DUF3343 domain-containing protein [Chloroflexota bacterium]|nr:DUF3343 domain-containing protein [Chloroflexota bacterium]